MSKPARYDCLVLGLGGAGSAALYHLSQTGKKLLGIEAHGIAHEQGSSHGATRIIRGAYHEDKSFYIVNNPHEEKTPGFRDILSLSGSLTKQEVFSVHSLSVLQAKVHAGKTYVPLLRRAWTLFHELQDDVKIPCIHQTGCLDVGSGIVHAAKEACDAHGVEYSLMTSAQVSQKFCGYEFGEQEVLHSPFGGIVESENCIRAHLAGAEKRGAQVELNTRVKSWEHLAGMVRVETEDGRSFEAKSAVFAAGSWMPQLIPELRGYLQPERQVVAWFEVDDAVSKLKHTTHPVWIMAHKNGGDYYGFPQFGDQPGFKIGRMHHLQEKVDPDAVRREVDEADIQILRQVVADCFPCANGRVLKSSTCLFTNTPDCHFLLDLHPIAANVVMVSACSGHGYKFTSVIGEIAKDLALTGKTAHDIAEFRLRKERAGVPDVLARFMKGHR